MPGIEAQMPNFLNPVKENNKKENEGEIKSGVYKFKHDFSDGTIGLYETPEQLREAIENEIENGSRAN